MTGWVDFGYQLINYSCVWLVFVLKGTKFWNKKTKWLMILINYVKNLIWDNQNDIIKTKKSHCQNFCKYCGY